MTDDDDVDDASAVEHATAHTPPTLNPSTPPAGDEIVLESYL